MMHLRSTSSDAMRRASLQQARRKIYELNRALLQAAGSGEIALTKDLLARGANVNFKNREGETPLSFAAAWNQLEVLKLLLLHNADPNIADRTGGTALMLAAQHVTPAMVRALLRKGADPLLEDLWGQTALMHADWRNPGDEQVEEIRKMIKLAAARSAALASH